MIFMARSNFLKFVMVSLLLMSAPSLGYPQEKTKLQDRLNSCQQNLNKEDFVNAIAECREALNINPKNAEALNNMGLAYAASGDLPFALKYADQAVTIDPQKADYIGNRATYKMRMGLIGEALIDFEKALELDPNNAQYYADRGTLSQQMSMTELAMKDFNKAIELDPSLASSAFKGLAKIYFEQGNLEQTLLNASKYLQFQPDDQGTLIIRGKMLKIKHDKFEPTNEQLLVDAVADCKRAVGKKADHAPAYACLASIYLSKNEFGLSIDSASRAIELGFTEGVYITRAIAHFKIRDFIEAQRDLLHATQILGETPNPKFLEDLTKAIEEDAAAREAAASTPEAIAAAQAAAEKAAAEEAAAAEAAAREAEKEAAKEAAAAEAAAAEAAYREAVEADAWAAEEAARIAEEEAATAEAAAYE